jgi:hypothetical protein
MVRRKSSNPGGGSGARGDTTRRANTTNDSTPLRPGCPDHRGHLSPSHSRVQDHHGHSRPLSLDQPRERFSRLPIEQLTSSSSDPKTGLEPVGFLAGLGRPGLVTAVNQTTGAGSRARCRAVGPRSLILRVCQGSVARLLGEPFPVPVPAPFTPPTGGTGTWPSTAGGWCRWRHRCRYHHRIWYPNWYRKRRRSLHRRCSS